MRETAIQTSDAFYPAKPMPWLITTFQRLFSLTICRPLDFHTQIDAQDIQRLKQFQKQPNGLVLAFNHSSMADIATILQFGAQAGVRPVVMASLSSMAGILPRRIVWPIASRLGIFSVNPAQPSVEKSKHYAPKIIQQAKFPLCIFPEGKFSWNNQKLSDCHTGAMQFALQAANVKRQAVNVVPIGIYYTYSQKAEKQAQRLLTKLEKKATSLSESAGKRSILRNASMQQRIKHLERWALAREEKKLNMTGADGSQAERFQCVYRTSMDRLFRRYGISPRVSQIRELHDLAWAINQAQRLQKKPTILEAINPWSSVRKAYREHLKKLQTDLRALETLSIIDSCQQAESLPSDFNSQIEALARLEYLVLGKKPNPLRVIRHCTGHLKVGESIVVKPQSDYRGVVQTLSANQLTDELKGQLQTIVQNTRQRYLSGWNA